MPVKLNGSTSGSVTITAPAVAGTNTLTLPAVTDTLVGLAATQTLTNKTLTSPTLTGPTITSPTITGVALSAGTTTVAPLDFASGTNLTTAIAGAMEYDGKVFYGTPQGTQRGIIPGQQFFRLNSALVGANSTAAQDTFGVSVTLSSSTVYVFEQYAVLTKTVGATSHYIATGFGGSATLNNILYTTTVPFGSGSLPVPSNTLSNNMYGSISNTATATNSVGTISNATANASLFIKGTVSVGTGGTFTPQYALSAAPGGAYSTAAGSYFLIYPIGASGSNTSVGAWA